ncbi:MAG: thioredoxin domain-containing protein, partial [Armatimonadetes bacterium]|nr:thioredoxin domain-containing protein [Anaerolineae bacterium]
MGCLITVLMAVLGFGGFFMVAPVQPSTQTEPATVVEGYAQLSHSRAEDGAFVLGEDDAPVTLLIFEDFYCPHCQSLHPTVTQLIEAYVATGAARYEFRFLATAGGEQLNQVARLLECAAAQRPAAFWEGHQLTYELMATDDF